MKWLMMLLGGVLLGFGFFYWWFSNPQRDASRLEQLERDISTGRAGTTGSSGRRLGDPSAAEKQFLKDEPGLLSREDAARQKRINAEMDRIEALRDTEPDEYRRRMRELYRRLCGEGEAFACEALSRGQ